MKNFLVPMMVGRVERAAAEAACVLAEAHEGRVDVVVGLSAVSPLVTGWEYFPAGMYDTLNETTRAAAEALAADARLAMAAEEAEHRVRVSGSFWQTPSEQSLTYARMADLIVSGRPREPSDADSRLFASLLLNSGRPVLVVPEARAQRPRFRRVVIAWKASREAARAVHDAMPLLERADKIDVVGVAEGERADLSPPDADLLRHLEAHGLKATFQRQAAGEHSTGETILQFAQVAAADIIVAGGYGHARAVEQVLGGVTRTLYKKSPIPVFFSH